MGEKELLKKNKNDEKMLVLNLRCETQDIIQLINVCYRCSFICMLPIRSILMIIDDFTSFFTNCPVTSRPTSESISKKLNLSSILNQTWTRPDLDLN